MILEIIGLILYVLVGFGLYFMDLDATAQSAAKEIDRKWNSGGFTNLEGEILAREPPRVSYWQIYVIWPLGFLYIVWVYLQNFGNLKKILWVWRVRKHLKKKE
jgi:hypothetical protein